MVDIDGPNEVINSAGKYSGTVTSAAEHTQGVADGFVVHRRPESSLDHALVAKKAWIKQAFDDATRAAGARATKTLQVAVSDVNAITSADEAGAAHVRNVSV